MKETSYHIAAVLMIIVVSICYHLNKKTSFFHNKCYMIFLWAIAFSSVSAIFTDGLANIIGINEIQYIFELIYHIAHAMCAPAALLYVISLRRELGELSLSEWASLMVPFIADELLIITNPLTNYVFSVENMVYSREPGMFFLYLVATYYLVYIIAYMMLHRRHYPKSVMVSISTIVFMVSGAVLIQMIFPNQRVENFALSLAALAILLAIQNPVSVIDTEYGIYNRESFVSITKYDFERKKKFYMMALVIDNFDHYRKALGDEFIVDAVKQITKTLLEIGAQKIYSMNEGVICVEFMRFSQMHTKTTKLCEIFDRPWYSQTSSAMLPVRLCVVNCPEDVETASELLNIVSWFENNKESPKVLYFSEVDKNNLFRNSLIKTAVKRVVETGEFGIKYSPVYSFERDGISYAEARLFIKDDKLGNIPDEEFSAVASKSGDMAKIGEAAFEKVCQFIDGGGLDKNGLRHIEVPFSVVQCVQDHMAERYLAILHKYHINPHKICFRISEIVDEELSTIIEDYLNDLHDEGFSFCFDNFGIGKSEISLIYNLPFAYVKIADSVVDAALNNGKAAIMFESTLNLMYELGINTIAGGVNNENSFRMLGNMNCHYAEGSFISGALDEVAFEGFLDFFKSPFEKGGVS